MIKWLSWTLLFGLSLVAAQERIALLIGNSAYQNRSVIKNATTEVKQVTEELRRCSFAIYRERALHNLSVRLMREVLDDFCRHVCQTNPKVVVVYYVGHGWEEDGNQYLVPVDMVDEKEIATQISIRRETFGEEDGQNLRQDVLGELLIGLPTYIAPIFAPAQSPASQSRVNILVVNACATNPFASHPGIASVFTIYAGGTESASSEQFCREFCRNLRQLDMSLAKMTANLQNTLGKPYRLVYIDRLGDPGRNFVWGKRSLQVNLVEVSQPIRGEVRLRARIVPDPEQVEFVVAGKFIGRGQKSGKYWECKWNSHQVANGCHRLEVQAYRHRGDNGEERPKAVGEITIDNLGDLEIALDEVAKPCRGKVFLASKVTPQPEKIEYLIAGKLLGKPRLQKGRWVYDWDSYAHPNGEYPLTVRAYRREDGKVFSQTWKLTIANSNPHELDPFMVKKRYYQAKLEFTTTIFYNGWWSNKQENFVHTWSWLKLAEREEIKRSERLDDIEVRMDGDIKVEGDALRVQANVCLQRGEQREPWFIQADLDVPGKKAEAKLKLSGGHWCQLCLELKKWQEENLLFLDMTSPEWEKLGMEKQLAFARLYQLRYAARMGLPIEKKFSVQEAEFDMRLVPPGRFWMGSPANEEGHLSHEKRRRVLISQPFYLSKYEVTQRQWQTVMATNPAHFKKTGTKAPVEKVSWNDCQKFCQKTGLNLPTEAQWEYACRSGTTTPFNLGMNIDTERVNYRCNREATVSVGSLNNANAWDLYDMHGNVWEWCEDAYKTFSYSYVDNAIDPLCKIGLLRVVRGGGCFNGADNCRSANSSCFPPGKADIGIGFRVMVAPGSLPR